MNLDFLNLNSLRNYPIQDDLSRVSDDGQFTIPNSLIVDMSVCPPQTGDALIVVGDVPQLYISRIVSGSANLVIEISVNGYGVFGTFQTVLSSISENTDVALTPGSLFPSATGIITIGSIADLTNLPYGNFTFSYPNTGLLMRVFSPNNSGVSWINFSDAQGNSAVLTGNIELIGNSNIQFRTVSGIVYIDAGEGLGLNKTCTTVPEPILTINGVGPDSNGNFTLIGSNCVNIADASFGVLLTNPCGQPCLGCDAIDTLTTQVNSLESSVLNLKTFVDGLQNVITQATNLISLPKC